MSGIAKYLLFLLDHPYVRKRRKVAGLCCKLKIDTIQNDKLQQQFMHNGCQKGKKMRLKISMKISMKYFKKLMPMQMPYF